MSRLTKEESLTTKQKVEQLGKAYNIKLEGSKEDKVLALEERMKEMMVEWNELER